MQKSMKFNDVSFFFVKGNNKRIHLFVFVLSWSYEFIKKRWFKQKSETL